MRMEETMDLKRHLCENMARVRDFYVKDLNYIPADKFDASPMGAAKTAKDMTLECAGLNRILVKLIAGEEAKHPSPEDRKASYASFKTAEDVKGEFSSSFDELIAKVEKLEPAQLDREITAPWGQTLPLGAMLLMGVSHVTYHDGQLNYIQSLYGDDKFHWME
jgi:hypothetical protein